jgi:hypothetical protein
VTLALLGRKAEAEGLLTYAIETSLRNGDNDTNEHAKRMYTTMLYQCAVLETTIGEFVAVVAILFF